MFFFAVFDARSKLDALRRRNAAKSRLYRARVKQSEEKYKKALEAAAVRNRRYRERKREMKEQYELAKRFYEDNLDVELL